MDRIIETKKDIKRIYYDEHRTSMEKYREISTIIEKLQDEEREVLRLEYESDLARSNGYKDMQSALNFWSAEMALLISVGGIVIGKMEGYLEVGVLEEVLGQMGLLAIALSLLYLGLSYRKGKDVSMIKYVLSILEKIN